MNLSWMSKDQRSQRHRGLFRYGHWILRIIDLDRGLCCFSWKPRLVNMEVDGLVKRGASCLVDFVVDLLSSRVCFILLDAKGFCQQSFLLLFFLYTSLNIYFQGFIILLLQYKYCFSGKKRNCLKGKRNPPFCHFCTIVINEFAIITLSLPFHKS